MRTFSLVCIATLSASALAADNVVLNSDFGVASGTLANWEFSEFPTIGTIGVTSQYFVSSRFSAQFNENFSAANQSSFLRQTFGAVTGVEEISLYGLSREQDIRVNLLYSDGTAGFFARFFTIPNLNDPVTNADWSKWDLTSDLDPAKTLI